MNKSNILICLGAGKKQYPLINEAFNMGFDLVIVDRDPYPLCEDKCLKIIKCSTHDSERVINELKRFFINFKPNGVIYYTSGQPLITAAYICKEFELPDISIELAKASVEKTFLYDFCKKLNIPIPYSKKVKSFEEIKDNQLGMVIKPDLPIGGTRNVFRLLDINQAKVNFEKSKKESRNDFVKVQNFINGLDVIVVAVVQKKEIASTLFIDQWVVLLESQFKKIGLSIPSTKFDSIVINKIDRVIYSFIKNCRINFGFISFSFRVDLNNDIWLYEVNPGLLGDNITEILLPKAFPDTFKNLFKFNLELIDGYPLKKTLKNPLPISIIEGELMSKEEAIKKIFYKNDFKELKERIKKFNSNN